MREQSGQLSVMVHYVIYSVLDPDKGNLTAWARDRGIILELCLEK